MARPALFNDDAAGHITKDWFFTSGGRIRSRRRPYDLVKIENRIRKRSHKLDGSGVGKIRTFPFLSIPFTTLSLMIQ